MFQIIQINICTGSFYIGSAFAIFRMKFIQQNRKHEAKNNRSETHHDIMNEAIINQQIFQMD